MSLYAVWAYAFHLVQVISTVLGWNDQDGQYGICAKTSIRDKNPQNDPTSPCFKQTEVVKDIGTARAIKST
jgi:hypothetical protein